MRLADHKGDKPVCADCDFSRVPDGSGWHCIRPECSRFDVVNGREPVRAKEARTSGPCGHDARYFVKRKLPSPWPPRFMGAVIVLAVIAYCTKGWLW